MSLNGIMLFSAIIPAIYQNTLTFVTLKCTTENVGQFGQQSMVECVIQTRKEVQDPTIRVVTWKKDNTSIFVFHGGKIESQQPRYSLAEPSWNVKNMNVSLLITNTVVADNGVYQCLVMTDSGNHKGSASLYVSAKYNKPSIHFTPARITTKEDATLQCESLGGYPVGQLHWYDRHNLERTEGVKMEVTQAKSGLFNLHSELTLHKGSGFSNYTCKVFSGDFEDETTFEEPDSPATEGQGQEMLTSTSKIVAPVVVIGSVIAGLLLALLIYRKWSHRGQEQVHTYETDAEERRFA